MKQWGVGFQVYGKTGDFSFGEWGDDTLKGEGIYVYNSEFDTVYQPDYVSV